MSDEIVLPPGVKEDDLRQVIKDHHIDDTISTADRFVGATIKVIYWVRTWLNDNNLESGKNKFAVFLLFEKPDREDGLEDGFDLIPLFKENTSYDFWGKIFGCNLNLGTVYNQIVDHDDLSKLGKKISDMGYSNTPCVIVQGGDPARFIICQNGILDDARQSIEINDSGLSDISVESLKDLLKQFHERYTKFPDGLGTVWETATKGVVERNAERNIRNSLFVFLKDVIFRTPYIARENQLENGRADIWIYPKAISSNSDGCVIELKVLRSRPCSSAPNPSRVYSNKYNERAARWGVHQANRYRDISEHCESAFLCCYDARDDDEELVEVPPYAKEKNVNYHRYFMLRSAQSDSMD